MAAGVPAEEAVELYNHLMEVDPSDTAEITRIQWRLQALRRRLPADIPAAIALLETYLLLGDATQGIALAADLWPRRQATAGDVALTYGAALVQLAMYDRGREFIQANEDMLNDQIGVFMASHSAWGLADTEYLLFISKQKASIPQFNAWSELFSEAKTSGVLAHFGDRQAIIRSHLFGRQTGTELLFTLDDNGGTTLAHYAYVNAERHERRKIEESIYDDLAVLYEKVGLGGTNFWSMAPVVVLSSKDRLTLAEERVPEAA